MNVPGGYSATRSPDGILTVHRVPIFAECSRNDVDYDGEWLRVAVMKAKQHEAEGYYAPMHVRHHEPATDMTDAVRPAGFFRVLGVETIQMYGKATLAVLADLIVTNPAVQADILAGRLPYRSVEIFNCETPALNSLALLDHEAPYLPLPMLMVGRVTDPVAGATLSPQPGAMVAGSFRHGSRALILFRFEDDMTNDKQTENFADGEDKKPPTEKKEGEGEKMEGGEGGGMDVEAIVKAIKSGEIMAKDLDAIAAAIKEYEANEVAEEPEGTAPAPAAIPGGEAMKQNTESTVQFAALQGEVQALKAGLAERDANDKRRTDVAEAMKALEGRPLGSDLETKLVAFHVEHGAKAFAAYVKSMSETFGKIAGGDRSAAAFSSQSQPATASKAATKYLDLGADAVGKAVQFSREWKEQFGKGLRASEESYIATNMKRLGYELQAS